MEKKLEIFSHFEECPVRKVLNRCGDKWSVLILLVLGEVDNMRFNKLHKTIGDISQKMLTVTLRTLEADGLIKRTVFPEIPPRVEYEITERGKSLLVHINNLVDWAEENMEAIMESRVKFES
ncbi:helix-turn-helix domain-containing protein [Marinifilum sp. D714]|uniref:winged helix-turn-helix transcriptional regulator n=1 Tax=Marinifilum sp. D714 TaxID=2937523 RepID=UPI0027C2D319|nr:helix-turn-helix domain-containing protein [Marinifilum sp. D714]MDQ2180516.1 helix-turn-helix transcriptional regulator [Marinifilum sp. D714]